MTAKLPLLVLILVVIMLSACTSTHGLYTPSSTANETYIERGNEYQVAETSDLRLVATGLDSDDENDRILVGMDAKGDKPVIVKDSQFSIYGGDISKDEWELIATWDAVSFYEKTRKSMESAIVANRIIGVLDIIGASFGSTSTSTIRNQYGTSYITTNTYDPSNVANAAMFATISDQSLRVVSQGTLQFLQENLLYTSTVNPDEPYAGLIFFPSDTKYPDYKIVFRNEPDSVDFVFSRTDREEILHPWTADKNRILNAVTLNFSTNQKKLSVNCLMLLPEGNGVGFYTGISFYNAAKGFGQNVNGYYYSSYGSGTSGNFSFNFDPDASDSYNYSFDYDGRFTESKSYYNAIGFPFGITYKLFDHTWLLVGVGFVAITDSYSVGKLEYSVRDKDQYKLYRNDAVMPVAKSPAMGVELQLGLNLAFNFIDVNAIASYDVLIKRFIFDIGCGFAL